MKCRIVFQLLFAGPHQKVSGIVYKISIEINDMGCNNFPVGVSVTKLVGEFYDNRIGMEPYYQFFDSSMLNLPTNTLFKVIDIKIASHSRKEVISSPLKPSV